MHTRLALNPAEIRRFVIVGGTCFTLGLGLLYLLTDHVGLNYLVSMALALVVVNFVGWLLNRLWTFGSTSDDRSGEFGRYLLVNLGSAGVTMVLMALLVSGLHMHYLVASVAVSIAMMFLSYFVHKQWSFRKLEKAPQVRS